MIFDGRGIKVNDYNFTDLILKLPDGTEEKYTYKEPSIRVGNILIPGKVFIEPTGSLHIKCSNGCTADLEFPSRGLFRTADNDKNRVIAKIRDAHDHLAYELDGQYTN